MELLLGGGAPVMKDNLATLVKGAEQVDLAVSYLQVSGWDILRAELPDQILSQIRIVCDDKMGITNPIAVRKMLDAGADVRAYSGARIYHPKVYLATRGGVSRAMLGSANLSEPALMSSVEAGVLLDDQDSTLATWFEELFANDSSEFDEERLADLESVFRNRLRGDLVKRKGRDDKHESAFDASLVDRVFSSLGKYVAPLSFDQGKNNVRSLETAQSLVRADPGSWRNDQKSELRFSGLLQGSSLTELGKNIAEAATIQEVVELWVSWFYKTPNDELPPRKFDNLIVAKRAFEGFWRMEGSVQSYFLDKSVNVDDDSKPILQAIELLANATPVGDQLSLEEVSVLAPLLTDQSRFPSNVSDAVRKYISNKASRAWGLPERRLILEAWRDA